jgi:hypothetical protein
MLRRIILLLTVVAIMAVMVVATAAPAFARPAKATVCHHPDGQDFHSISVSPNAVPAHLAHGDFLGVTPEECEGL